MSDAAAGDRAAFAAIMRLALPRAWRVAMRLLGNAAEAEDVAQEAMVRVWRHAGRFDARRAPFEVWLGRIVTNLALDQLRARRRAGPAAALDEAAALPDPAEGAEQHLLRQGRVREVEQALQNLPERQRAAIVLVHYEGFSGAAAARTLGLTPKAVEGLLYRALAGLRRALLGENGAADE